MTQNTLITDRLIATGAVIAILLIVGWLLIREQPGESFDGRASGSIQAPPEGSWKRIDNPLDDGWKTEVIASEIARQLEKLQAVIAGETGAGNLASIVDDSFACRELRPKNLETAYEGSSLVVQRKNPGTGKPESLPLHRGIAGLEEALGGFTEPWSRNRDVRASFKVYGIEEKEGLVETTQHLAILSRSAAGLLEEHSTWTAHWKKEGAASPALLTFIETGDIEQTRSRRQEPLFSDRTGAVLGTNPSFRRQLQLGLNHWLNRSQDNRFFALLGTPGLALGDVNGDGLDDLYVCQEGGLPNLLFLRNPDGTATDNSASSGANWLESSRAALLVDLDNDGRQDLAVTVRGALVIAAGDGAGRFELRSCLPTGNDTMSVSAADPDLDGDLDLYVCSHKADDLSQDAGVVSIGAAEGFVYHDANNAAANILFRNDIPATGSWTFTDITEESGLDSNNRRFSFAAAWEDYDNDGDPDLYVANDFGRNNFYRNEREENGRLRFVDIAAGANAEDSASGMSVSWGDYDRDGNLDIYVSNMFSAAGSRVTRQALFKPEASGLVRQRLQRFARGNTLLRGGDAGFEDVSLRANVNMGRWAWGSGFVDINGDGWDDLVVANGYITTEDTGDL